jgi:DNA-binding SARP family transcriptional activator
MDIHVLGALSVRIGGRAVMPTAAKPRKVLALLALHANEVVPICELQTELWGDRVPRSASTTLQTYVLHLRTLIGEALRHAPAGVDRTPKHVLVTHPGGYLLDNQGGAVDMTAFERLAEEGHRARENGDAQLASTRYSEALAQWTGDALFDVSIGPVLEVELDRLDEARLNVLDRRIDADLRLGRHHELLGELTALVARHRTHEGLCAQMMLALCRSGRRGEAIDAYRRLRTNLVQDLGLEPSPAVRELQRMILSADPRLTGGQPDEPARWPAWSHEQRSGNDHGRIASDRQPGGDESEAATGREHPGPPVTGRGGAVHGARLHRHQHQRRHADSWGDEGSAVLPLCQ